MRAPFDISTHYRISTWRGTHSKLLEITPSVRMGKKKPHQTLYNSKVLPNRRKCLKDKMDRRYCKLALGAPATVTDHSEPC